MTTKMGKGPLSEREIFEQEQREDKLRAEELRKNLRERLTGKGLELRIKEHWEELFGQQEEYTAPEEFKGYIREVIGKYVEVLEMDIDDEKYWELHKKYIPPAKYQFHKIIYHGEYNSVEASIEEAVKEKMDEIVRKEESGEFNQ